MVFVLGGYSFPLYVTSLSAGTLSRSNILICISADTKFTGNQISAEARNTRLCESFVCVSYRRKSLKISLYLPCVRLLSSKPGGLNLSDLQGAGKSTRNSEGSGFAQPITRLCLGIESQDHEGIRIREHVNQ